MSACWQHLCNYSHCHRGETKVPHSSFNGLKTMIRSFYTEASFKSFFLGVFVCVKCIYRLFIVYLNLIMCEMSENLDKREVSVCSLLSAGYVALCAYLVWSQVWICRYAAYCNLHFSIVCFLLLSGSDLLKMSSVSLKRLKCYWSHSLYIFCMLIMKIQTCVIEMFQIIQDIWCFKKKKSTFLTHSHST